jgi:diguanylate cyclase (GGDEF)-like protein/PAS domain S-box-containing protein
MSRNNSKTITDNADALDKAYLGLARNWALWQEELQPALEHITEAVSKALMVQRTSIWLLAPSGEHLELLDLYAHGDGTHSSGNILERRHYPEYFIALGRGRVIDAIDAHLDPRTREFREGYLEPLGIGAMLDATLWVAGETRGVICSEHIGGPRIWNEAESRFIVSVADLVSQILVNDRIRRSEARYTQLLDNMPSVAYRGSCAPECHIEYISGGIKELTGYTVEEFTIGKRNFWELVHPDDRERVQARISSSGEQREPFDIEYRIITREGDIRWIHDLGRTVYSKDGKAMHQDGIISDITDRIEAQNQLRAANARQQAILNGADYSIIYTDIEGTIQKINAAAERMLGYSADEMIGKMSPISIHLLDEIRLRAAELSQELDEVIEPGFEIFIALARDGKVDEREWTYVHKDGTHIPILLSITAIRENGGGITGYLGVASDISERVQSEQAIRDSEKRYRTLFEASGDSIFVMHEDSFVDCNEATLEMFGCTREQIIGKTPYRFSPEYQPDGSLSSEKALEKIEAAFSGRKQLFEWQHIRYDGTPFDAEVTLTFVSINDQPSVLASVRDISARKRADTELEQSRQELLERNESLRLINELSMRLHNIHDVETITEVTIDILNSVDPPPHIALYLLDQLNSQLQLANSSRMDKETVLIGADLPLEGSLSGLALTRGGLLISPDISTDERVEPIVKDILLKRGIQSAIIIPMINNNQPIGTINLVFNESPSFSQVEIETLAAVGRTVALAISNARQLDDLEYQAYHDSLTGLPNRVLLHRAFEEKILQQPDPDRRGALLLLDLDRFKEINDTLGHHVGDSLLALVGVRLNAILGPVPGVACRLGGDEFAFLLTEIHGRDEIEMVTGDILDALRQPFVIGDMSLNVDVSIGISLYPEDGRDSHELLRSADVAMYQAKQSSSNLFWYDSRHDSHSRERLSMMGELGQAIRDGNIELHYQPKLDLELGRITGFEALVRWQHPRLGLLMPGAFIPLAEMGETIQALSHEVMEQALAQQQQWRESGQNFAVAVNLSARNLQDNRCADTIQQLMRKYDTRPGDLELEITETSLMHDPEGSARILNNIAALGVTVSVDDFGTGYSSLNYLRKLPIQTLKIDRSFVRDMLHNEQDAIIVRSTISLAHNLKLNVIAEGVEDEETLKMLEQMGCDQIQGYHICRPSPWDELAPWLADSKHSLS